MPYEMTWVPASTDKNLTVHEEKPEGSAYECHFCGGWIKGRPSEFEENTLGPLCGRKGTVQHCCRCGHEIGFFGEMS